MGSGVEGLVEQQKVYSNQIVKLLHFVYCFSYCASKQHKQTIRMGVGNGNKAAALQFSTSGQDTEKSVLFLFSLKLCGGLVFYFHISFYIYVFIFILKHYILLT